MPEMNTLTVGIVAVMAQHERELISSRTRGALERKKARGYKLGKPENLTPMARLKGMVTRQENARYNLANRQASVLVVTYRDQMMTFDQIAIMLNDNGFRTRTGKSFFAMSVRRLYHRKNQLVDSSDLLQ